MNISHVQPWCNRHNVPLFPDTENNVPVFKPEEANLNEGFLGKDIWYAFDLSDDWYCPEDPLDGWPDEPSCPKCFGLRAVELED